MRGAFKIPSALLLVAVLNSGCLTRALWKSETRVASRDPRLSLAVPPDNSDVLVQYDEHQEGRVRRRSYWLFEYATHKGGEGKPNFVKAGTLTDINFEPIRISDAGSNSATVGGFIASADFSQTRFKLHRDGVALGDFDLPSYTVDAKPTFGRVVLTPVAAAADGMLAV